MHIRPLQQTDLPALVPVLEDTELFPPAMLEGMTTPYFSQPESQEQWLVCTDAGQEVVGFAYFRPEALTDGTWNLLAIGFRHHQQGRGYGAKLVAAVEQTLAQERVLIVETSSLDSFAATRQFYTNAGYDEEAVIRDYWAAGDDKVIFRKQLM